MIRYRNSLVNPLSTHLKVAEKGVYEKVQNDEWRKNGVKNTHENKPPSQSVWY